ncbi:MAG: hypothetical protein JF589_17905 [Gemmatimonadetes bacterium]|nr:hypothetical protein [Gemmatimonadota bacterium]
MSAAFVVRRARVAALALALVLFARLAQAAIAAGDLPPSVAQRVSPSSESARVAFERTLPPMRGDHLHVALVEVTYEPGASSLPHVHRCPVSGYVVSRK